MKMLAQVVQFKEAVNSTLRNVQSNKSANHLYKKTKAFCIDHDIQERATEPRRKQKHMDDFIVDSSTEKCGGPRHIGAPISRLHPVSRLNAE